MKENSKMLNSKFAFLCCTLALVLFGFTLILSIVSSVKNANNRLNKKNYWALEDEISQKRDFHKYLMIDRTTNQEQTLESKKQINEFSLYPVDYGVDVFPILNEDESFGSGIKEYLCTCDLEELIEAFERTEDYDIARRSITKPFKRSRRVAIVSSGLIISGVISVLMLIWKTNIVQLRIFANSELQALEYTTRELSHRIMSEIDEENASPQEIFGILKRLKFEELEKKISKTSSCEQTEYFPEERDKNKEKSRLIRCNAICDILEDGEDGDLEIKPEVEDEADYFNFDEGMDESEESCIFVKDWDGNFESFGSQDVFSLGKKALENICYEKVGIKMIMDGSLECVDYDDEGFRESCFDHNGFKNPKECGKESLNDFLADLRSEFGRIDERSCYEYLL